MPIKIPAGLPAKQILDSENVFTMTSLRAMQQDIRPLRIAVLNLMPTKILTETQLIRVLSNTSIQLELFLIETSTYQSRHTAPEHLSEFYRGFDDVRNERFDGLIITGAPIERLNFSEVHYWNEMCEIMDWSKTHVFSTIYICWAAFAGLYHNFGIDKYPLPEKLSGIFEHTVDVPSHPLLRGFDERFLVPHSRYSKIRTEDIKACPGLSLLASSERAGAYIIAASDNRSFYITGHSEYDFNTLDTEYKRDLAAGKAPRIPENYYPQNDPSKTPLNCWRAHSHLLFSNWLNYFVYQETPYDLTTL